jgi:hypothetical protein
VRPPRPARCCVSKAASMARRTRSGSSCQSRQSIGTGTQSVPADDDPPVARWRRQLVRNQHLEALRRPLPQAVDPGGGAPGRHRQAASGVRDGDEDGPEVLRPAGCDPYAGEHRFPTRSSRPTVERRRVQTELVRAPPAGHSVASLGIDDRVPPGPQVRPPSLDEMPTTTPGDPRGTERWHVRRSIRPQGRETLWMNGMGIGHGGGRTGPHLAGGPTLEPTCRRGRSGWGSLSPQHLCPPGVHPGSGRKTNRGRPRTPACAGGCERGGGRRRRHVGWAPGGDLDSGELWAALVSCLPPPT